MGIQSGELKSRVALLLLGFFGFYLIFPFREISVSILDTTMKQLIFGVVGFLAVLWWHKF